MKKILCLAAAAAISTMSISAMADNNVTAAVKMGQYVIDEADNGDAPGFGLGYSFGNISIEYDYTKGSVVFANGLESDINRNGIFGVYRSPGNAYYMAKIGYVHTVFDGGDTVSPIDIKQSNASYGVGFGYRFADEFSVEAEYTVDDKQAKKPDEPVNLLALSVRFSF